MQQEAIKQTCRMTPVEKHPDPGYLHTLNVLGTRVVFCALTITCLSRLFVKHEAVAVGVHNSRPPFEYPTEGRFSLCLSHQTVPLS